MSEASAGTESPAVPSSRRRWMRVFIGVPLFGIVCYFVGRSLASDFGQIDWSNLRLNYLALAGAFACLVLSRFMNGLNCSVLLASLGHPISVRRVTPVIWLASLGRYVPGKMAVVAGAAIMLTRLGVRMPAALASLFLSTALMIIMSLITCLPLLAMPAIREAMPFGWLLGLLILLGGLVCLHPRVFMTLVNFVLRRLKRQPLPSHLATGPLLQAILVSLFRSLLLSAGLCFTAQSMTCVPASAFALFIGSAGLASVAGFLAVFAPAGLGVHEGVYLLTLSPLLGPAAALLAIVFRLLHIVSDIVTAAIALPLVSRSTGNRAGTSEVESGASTHSG